MPWHQNVDKLFSYGLGLELLRINKNGSILTSKRTFRAFRLCVCQLGILLFAEFRPKAPWPSATLKRHWLSHSFSDQWYASIELPGQLKLQFPLLKKWNIGMHSALCLHWKRFQKHPFKWNLNLNSKVGNPIHPAMPVFIRPALDFPIPSHSCDAMNGCWRRGWAFCAQGFIIQYHLWPIAPPGYTTFKKASIFTSAAV